MQSCIDRPLGHTMNMKFVLTVLLACLACIYVMKSGFLPLESYVIGVLLGFLAGVCVAHENKQPKTNNADREWSE